MESEKSGPDSQGKGELAERSLGLKFTPEGEKYEEEKCSFSLPLAALFLLIHFSFCSSTVYKYFYSLATEPFLHLDIISPCHPGRTTCFFFCLAEIIWQGCCYSSLPCQRSHIWCSLLFLRLPHILLQTFLSWTSRPQYTEHSLEQQQKMIPALNIFHSAEPVSQPVLAEGKWDKRKLLCGGLEVFTS